MLARATVPVLCYHQIRDVTPDDGPLNRSLTCPPGLLERHMRTLTGAGMQPVTSPQLVDHVQFGTPLPPRPVVISFDDASEGQFTNALPVLERLSMPATFFVMTVVLDKPNWLSREQVRMLDRAGMTIGAHTFDHHPVTEYTGTDWAAQLQRPKAELEQILGHPLDLFAYPYGAWNAQALPHVQDAGYRAAFQLSDQPPDPQRPLFTLRRILMSSQWNEKDLLARLQV
jgi:peptidoglycan/xylan/chitin deacetylase (PgdA/CDA1 family)